MDSGQQNNKAREKISVRSNVWTCELAKHSWTELRLRLIRIKGAMRRDTSAMPFVRLRQRGDAQSWTKKSRHERKHVDELDATES